MTKLSRIPRLLLLPALCLAACTADEPATLNADGQALVIEDLRIAGSGTRAAQPIEGSFVESSRLQAIIEYDGQTSTGLYGYNNNMWMSHTSAYWLTGKEQTVTLRTPYPEPIPAMPPAFNATNWHEYDILEYSGQTTPTTSFTLSHMRAQLCVTLKAGTGLTDDDLAGAKVTINNSTELWHTNGAHYALLDPATYATLPALTITLGSETYTYNPGTDAPAPALAAGECLMLTLSVSKAQVSALSTTSTGWQELTATGTEVAGVTVLYCPTPGSLSTTNNLDNLSGRVYVTGTINNDDLNALTDKLASVTHLYIVAESGVTGGLTVPERFAYQSPYSNTSLQAVAILHAASIGGNAFSSCTSLTSIDLPKAETIGDYAFDNCASLTSIDLPKAETIGDNTFGVCTNLESIDLPQATSIGNGAFSMCTSLTSIDLPIATSIGNDAFWHCPNLKSIDLPVAIGIGSYAFQECSGLTSIDLPVATSIGGYAFRDCASLTSIDLPAATSIGSSAFQGCSSLTSIDLPAATRIGSYAFYSCEKLENINLPAANDIGIEAFGYCSRLESIAVPSTTVGSNIFIRSFPTTLFLTDEDTTADTAAGSANWGGITWQTIYYGYRGSGDYLDPGSYEGQWTRE